MAEAISKAKQPLICAGGGVWLAHAQKELLELAQRNQIPVVKTMMGLSVMATDHPLNMGMIGPMATTAPTRLWPGPTCLSWWVPGPPTGR